MSKQKILAIGTSVVVLAAVIVGLFIAGSPADERTRRADEQRISDLQNISYAVQAYYVEQGTLPASLEEAARQPNVFVTRITDPETNVPYAYQATSNSAYQLCATFQAATPTTGDRSAIPPELSFWNHDIGQTCYDLDAQPTETGFRTVPQ